MTYNVLKKKKKKLDFLSIVSKVTNNMSIPQAGRPGDYFVLFFFFPKKCHLK